MSRVTEPADHTPRGEDASASELPPLNKSIIARWSLWSWGNATVSAVMTTFVFGTYLTSPVFDPAVLPEGDSPGDRGAQYLAVATAIAGAVVALTAPVIGQRTDKAGRRRLGLTLNTVMVITMVALCFFVRPEEGYLLLGVTLMALMGIFDEFANLNYNAMITDISDHQRMGRVSGIGWGAGYLGGIVLLLLVYVAMIEGDWLGIGSDDAVNIRAVALVAAGWHLLFALPLLLTRLKTADSLEVEDSVSVAESYRRLFRVIAGLWREDRNTLWFLLASAIYRDGLSAVFVWGAVLGVHVYRIEDADIPFTEIAGSVLLFGVAGNVVAAIGAFIGGWFDDRLGPRRVIAFSLVSLLGIALFLWILVEPRELGPVSLSPVGAFWFFGLLLCLFVGPAQASSRAFLGRLAPPSRAGELFGLYATAGRGFSFVTPALIGLLIFVFGGQVMAIPGIAIVLTLGLVLLLVKVRDPAGPAKMHEHSKAH
ncbi:MFS transporter [Nesterenkonia natronophila]|uniref:MFS transporter n=1 Tax=Nesterenkonia natronophila TaxID=2174932 RepID=A0A3A4FD35_9MICC|nr:MFS transporter [Nesterenkonia natronophila]RJN32704.1 MFS transporter [Nesterenkonia natronophila]